LKEYPSAAKELNDLYTKLMRSIEDADELQMQLNEMLAKQKLSNKDLIDVVHKIIVPSHRLIWWS
jgi:hypothetical protein